MVGPGPKPKPKRDGALCDVSVLRQRQYKIRTYRLRRLVPSAVDASFFDVREVLMSRRRGRNTGIH